jgi:hypothetical protein
MTMRGTSSDGRPCLVEAVLRVLASLALLAGWSRSDLTERLNAALIDSGRELGLSPEQFASRIGVTSRSVRGWRARLGSYQGRVGLEVILRMFGLDVPGPALPEAAIKRELRELRSLTTLIHRPSGTLVPTEAVKTLLERHARSLARVAQLLKPTDPASEFSEAGSRRATQLSHALDDCHLAASFAVRQKQLESTGS